MNKLRVLLIRNKNIKIFLLSILRPFREFYFKKLLSPEKFLKKKFKKKIGKELDLDNPKTYNEKLQYLKFKQVGEVYSIISDKYRVRNYVSKRINEDILVPLLWVGTNPKDIPYEALPEKFVIKANHNSGPVIIVEDKSKINKKNIERELKFQLKRDYSIENYQLNYKDIPRKIIIETLLVTQDGKLAEDYKFFCFNGEVKFVKLTIDRYGNNKENFYDKSWNYIDTQIGIPNDTSKEYIKPRNFEKMIQICEELSKPFPHLRVDLYNLDGKIYLGELTLYHLGGLGKFIDESLDLRMGEWIDLNNVLI